MRTSQQWQDVLAIIVSAIASKVQQHYAIGLDTHAYFSKPVLASRLSPAVTEKLSNK